MTLKFFQKENLPEPGKAYTFVGLTRDAGRIYFEKKLSQAKGLQGTETRQTFIDEFMAEEGGEEK